MRWNGLNMKAVLFLAENSIRNCQNEHLEIKVLQCTKETQWR